jgi:mRNA interferase RelE/StbE
MELVIEKAALKGLRKMPSKMAMALQARLEAIADAPFAHHANVKALVGEKDAFRLRQGDWRAVYRIVRERAQMRVVLVDVRVQIYR